MRIGPIALAFVALLLGHSATASPPPAGGHATYHYCNVYLSEVCFGIGRGDELTMTIPIDFVLYRVRFAGGGSALVYVGGHPDVDGLDTFDDCSATSAFAMCKRKQFADGRWELLVQRDAKADKVHVVIGGTQSSLARSFLNNFRPCTTREKILTCPQAG